jgi:Bax protein
MLDRLSIHRCGAWLALVVVVSLLGSSPLVPLPEGRAWPIAVGRGSLPATLAQAVDGSISIPERKARFVAFLLPLIDEVNARILVERRTIERLRGQLAAGARLSPSERRWLGGVMARYRVTGDDLGELLLRVDVVPPSLALAQAALESGWGTSRLARETNALFGERVWPAGATADSLAYRRFPGIMASIDAYALNLNRHETYAGFRSARAALRGHGWLDGYVLAGAIHGYSEIGTTYVTRVREIIRGNRLAHLDVALLDG